MFYPVVSTCVNLVYVLCPKLLYFRQTLFFAVKGLKSKDEKGIIFYLPKLYGLESSSP